MAGKFGSLGVKLALAGLLVLLGVQLVGLSTRAPAADTDHRPQAAMSPPASPAAKTAALVAKPAALTPAEDALVIKRVLKIEQPFEHGDWVWDEEGIPDGQVIITVDLAAQTLSVFRGGYEIGAAVILYGATDKPSPLGVYPITQRKKDHVSNLYNAPMPYMLRLTNDGVAIHGSDVEWGRATHGCIGVPLEFAEKLFGATKLGDHVIITDGKMLDLGPLATGA